jgi:hypothetical protein
LPIDQNRIPLYSPGENIVGYFSAVELKRMAGVEVTANKRGNITRAYLKPLTCHVVRHSDFSSLYGTCSYQRNEQLPSGYKIYQLRRLSV